MTESVRATRVMKARSNGGLCGYCGGWIARGVQIALVPDQGWWHSTCVIKAQADWSEAYKPSQAELERRKAIETERRLTELRANGQIVR